LKSSLHYAVAPLGKKRLSSPGIFKRGRNGSTKDCGALMKVEILNRRRVFDGFFKIEEARIRFERFDGSMTEPLTRLCFERGDSVAAIIRNVNTNKIILANQFKYPSYAKGPGWITEVVAGMIAPSETAEEALKREILEETGYRVVSYQPISTFYVSPGGSSERIILYYVEVSNGDRINAGGGLRSEGEDIKLVEFALPELWEAMSSGEFVDAKTLLSLFWLKEYLREETR
jgi:nudix-type nucleoside diphosphatase (YffH/AdpP family)